MKDAHKTREFCLKRHPDRGVPCVLDRGHDGDHLGYVQPSREEWPPDADPGAVMRVEVRWER